MSDEVKAEEFTEARDREAGRYVSDEEAEENPDKVIVEEFIVLRDRRDIKERGGE